MRSRPDWPTIRLPKAYARWMSAVALLWNEATVNPGGERKVGFTYGLAKVASGGPRASNRRAANRASGPTPRRRRYSQVAANSPA